MTRAKVQLTYLQNDSARKSTLKKRKIGLIKKANQLSTLWGVGCCVVIYGPNCPEPDVWPSRPDTEKVIARYQDKPDFFRLKYMEDQESLTNQKLARRDELLKKIQKENRLKELCIVNKCASNNIGWVQGLDGNYLSYIKNNVFLPHLEEVEEKIAMLQQLHTRPQ